MLTPQWIGQATGGRLLRPRATPIEGFSLDSRTLEPGQFFVALRGRRRDGHDFLEEAFRKGASGALIGKAKAAKAVPQARNLVLVEETHSALMRLAAAYRALFQVPLIGVTGSVGKTTTKELLGRMLATRFRAYRSPGNLNTEYGLPLSLLNMPLGTQVGVFELALQRPGELKPLAELLDPSIGVITAVGEAHREFFQDREQIAAEKWALIEALPPTGGMAVLNADDPLLWARSTGQRFRVDFALRQGKGKGKALYRAEDLRDHSLEGLAFTLVHPHGRLALETRLLGRHNVYNVLAAAAVALELRVTPEAIQEVVSSFTPCEHRLQMVPSRFGIALDDCYNASPSAVREALATLGRLDWPHRKVFVFGDMRELGEEGPAYHRQVARWIVAAGIDQVFTVGELAAQTAQALREGGWPDRRAQIARTREELTAAIARALSGSGSENLILIKGSRALGLEQVVTQLSA